MSVPFFPYVASFTFSWLWRSSVRNRLDYRQKQPAAVVSLRPRWRPASLPTGSLVLRLLIFAQPLHLHAATLVPALALTQELWVRLRDQADEWRLESAKYHRDAV